jgi:hypothetical protein
MDEDCPLIESTIAEEIVGLLNGLHTPTKDEAVKCGVGVTHRKAFVCASCHGVYADQPVSACDCVPEEDVFIEGVITYPEQVQPPGNDGELPTASDRAINAAYVRCFGSEINWLDTEGSYFVEGYRAGLAAQAQPPVSQTWQSLAAALYQACGAYDMPERILDALSAAQHGEPFDHLIDGLLPCNPPVSQSRTDDRDEFERAFAQHRPTAANLKLLRDGDDYRADYSVLSVAWEYWKRGRAALAQQVSGQDREDAERYRDWRAAAIAVNRAFLGAAHAHAAEHFPKGSPTIEQFDAGIDAARSASGGKK